MKKSVLCMVLGLLLLMTACTQPQAPLTPSSTEATTTMPLPTEKPEEDNQPEDMEDTSLSDLVSHMPLRDKITQMMMVDFRQWGSQDFTVMNDQVQKIMEDYGFGGVIYFANNIKTTEDTFNLTQAFQQAATKNGGIPLLIAADQEGGSVYRLGTGTALPGNMALGATYELSGTKYAYEAGKIIGSELSVLGINVNLAPVVDVNNNPNNPVIGLRSYSDDATAVGQLASAQIAGMKQFQVIGCVKHFPGHGDTATDSHYGLPVVDKSLEQLLENELKPYEIAIAEGVEMVMAAHILYPQLEQDRVLSQKTGKEEALPATLSDDIITGLLKEQMGFPGVVITDAMNMAGITDTFLQTQAAVLAISAGVDMLCMPTSGVYTPQDLSRIDDIIDSIAQAVEQGKIPQSRINDAVTRILTLKKDRGILSYDPEAYTLEKAQTVVGGEENRSMERQMAAAAVTVVRNDKDTLPLKIAAASKVLVLVPYNNEMGQIVMAWNRAHQAGLIPEGAQLEVKRFQKTDSGGYSNHDNGIQWADVVIVISEISSANRYSSTNSQNWLYAGPNGYTKYAKSLGKATVVMSADKPYDVQMYPYADAVLAVYGCKGSSIDPTEALIGGVTATEQACGPNIIAGMEVALGIFGATGKLPVNVYEYDIATKAYTQTLVYQRGYGLTYDPLAPKDN